MTRFDDLVRGRVEFSNSDIEDFVIRRGDGSPTFIVANAVDDADLGITHVVRGEDLLNPTPRILMVREAIGAGPPPVFAHLPLIVNEQRKKLSKRRDDVSLASYRDQGILAEAMVNYLALLGWGPPDNIEIRPISEIIDLFELTDINPAPATFDQKKLGAMNGEYIRKLSVDAFIDRAMPVIVGEPWADRVSRAQLETIAEMVQPRLRSLNDLPSQVDFLFLPAAPVDEKSWEKVMVGSEDAHDILGEAAEAFASCEWQRDVLHAALLAIGEARGKKLGKVQAPVRVAVTGRTVGPPLFESLELLGREETLARIATARAKVTG